MKIQNNRIDPHVLVQPIPHAPMQFRGVRDILFSAAGAERAGFCEKVIQWFKDIWNQFCCKAKQDDEPAREEVEPDLEEPWPRAEDLVQHRQLEAVLRGQAAQMEHRRQLEAVLRDQSAQMEQHRQLEVVLRDQAAQMEQNRVEHEARMAEIERNRVEGLARVERDRRAIEERRNRLLAGLQAQLANREAPVPQVEAQPPHAPEPLVFNDEEIQEAVRKQDERVQEVVREVERARNVQAQLWINENGQEEDQWGVYT